MTSMPTDSAQFWNIDKKALDSAAPNPGSITLLCRLWSSPSKVDYKSFHALIWGWRPTLGPSDSFSVDHLGEDAALRWFGKAIAFICKYVLQGGRVGNHQLVILWVGGESGNVLCRQCEIYYIHQKSPWSERHFHTELATWNQLPLPDLGRVLSDFLVVISAAGGSSERECTCPWWTMQTLGQERLPKRYESTDGTPHRQSLEPQNQQR